MAVRKKSSSPARKTKSAAPAGKVKISRVPASLAQVARLADVSTATVSRAFNEPEKVRPELRRRIVEVAERLRYRPNRLVGGVLRGQAPIIGIVINTLNVAFMPELLGGIFAACEAADFTCMVYDSRNAAEREVEALKLCIQHRLAGVLLFPLDEEEKERGGVLREMRELGIAVVNLMSPAGASKRAPLIANDDRGGAIDAVTHLIGLGHRRILHLSGSTSHYRTSDERLLGYRDAHRRAGIKVAESLIVSAGFGPEKTFQILEAFERRPGGRPYTAIFSASDYPALEALQFFHERGIAVPDEVSVVGFGDFPTSSMACPPLTTVNQEFDTLGTNAARLCIELSRKSTSTGAVKPIPARLVIRKSTALARKKI